MVTMVVMGAPPQIPLSKTAQTLRFLVRPVSFMDTWRNRLGETFHASVHGPGELIFISDPESVKALFKADRVNTIAPGRNIVLGALLGPGSLLLQEGDEHLRRRRLMLPPFHGERMRAYEDVIAKATEDSIDSWPVGEPFRLHTHMQHITLEVILRAVFGIEDEDRREELRAGLYEILEATASPRAVGFVAKPLRRVPPYRALSQIADRIDELLAAEIAERRREAAESRTEEREDILSMLVSARFEDGEAMGDAELRDQLMTLILAGHETTATGLAWTFDLLFGYPETLRRATDEARARNGSEYVDAVVEESLRVRPVVPFTGRELRQDAELAGYELREGTVAMAGIYLLHTRPDVYPDPYAFRPERFLDSDAETYSWIPFGGGTRRCIGAAFAQLEMRIALQTILRSCDLRSATGKPEQPVRRNVTMSPAGGTAAILDRRL